MSPDPAVLRAAVHDHGLLPDDDVCMSAVYAATREMDSQAVGVEEMDWDVVNAVVAKALGAEHPDAVTVAAITAAFRQAPYIPLPGAATVLAHLHRRGYSLGVVSNGHGTVEEQLALHQICSVGGGSGTPVSAVLDSTVVGVSKPDSRIFTMALEALRVRPAEAVYIGDSLFFDIDAAKAMGMQAIHLDPGRGCGDSSHNHVQALEDLLMFC